MKTAARETNGWVPLKFSIPHFVRSVLPETRDEVGASFATEEKTTVLRNNTRQENERDKTMRMLQLLVLVKMKPWSYVR